MKTRIISLLLLVCLVLTACGTPKDTSAESETGSAVSEESKAPQTKTFTIDEDEIYDKILGSWVGQAAGVVWGASTEFRYQKAMIPDNEVPKIETLNLNDVAGQDDLYVEIPFLEAMDQYGVNCSLKQLADKFRDSQFGLDHANKIGRENLRNGIEAPMSGHYENNMHADDIDWQIEADFVGHLYPGMINEAAARAFEIGHIMNYGDGVYGGVFVSAMHAAAFTAKSIDEIIDAGIKSIPENTKFRMVMEDVMKWHSEGKTWKECWLNLEEKWEPTKRCLWYVHGAANIDAKLNAAYILIGLLYGEGDFDNSMKISMQCGQDSDCNPSSVGAILGNYYGYKALPDKWKSKMDLTGFKFAFTNHTMKSIVDLNYKLTLELLESKKFTKDGKKWEITVDGDITPVPFEQIPDLPLAEASYSLKDNILSVSLNAHDLNGIKSIEWDFGDGAKDNSNNTIHLYKAVGTYTVKCVITNNNDQSVTLDKSIKVEKIDQKVSPNKGTVRNIAPDGAAICSDILPTGSGSKDLNIISDGKKSGSNTDQYDTYIGYMGPHEDYVGYIFYEDFKVSSVVFTEGMHFNNGGWFADGSLKLQALVDNKWVDVNASVSPAYPSGNTQSAFGASFTQYTFSFDELECSGIRLIGTAGGEAGFISIAELEVTGVEVDS